MPIVSSSMFGYSYMKQKAKKIAHMRTDRMRQVRELKHFTQEDLADRSGLSASQIYRIESGKSEPSADAVVAIAKGLEVSADYLLGLSDDIGGHITEQDLTPMERRLLNAYRNSKDQGEKLRNLIRAIASDEELMAEPEK